MIMQDTDRPRERGGDLHWTAFNIKATKLDAGMTDLPSGSRGPGMRQRLLGTENPRGLRVLLSLPGVRARHAAEAGATIDSLQRR